MRIGYTVSFTAAFEAIEIYEGEVLISEERLAGKRGIEPT